MSKFTVHHTTTYTYEGNAYDSANQIMLYPIKDKQQEVLEHKLIITGNPSIDVFIDYYGNEVGTFTYSESHKQLKIESILVVNVSKKPLPEHNIFPQDEWNLLKKLTLDLPYVNFLNQETFKAQEQILEAINPLLKENNTPLEVANYLCNYVYKEFQYIKGITNIETTVDEIWKLKSGVCQDFAHILLVMLRYRGIPARYVSGYICPNKTGMRGEGATHAWVEAYLPDYGWLGLDPTNNCIVNDTHVRLAVGRNFVDCSPVKGTYKGTSRHTLEVKVMVEYEQDSNLKTEKPQSDFSLHDAPINSYKRFIEMQQQQQ